MSHSSNSSNFEPKDLVAALSMAIRLRRMEINRSQEGLSYGAGFSRGYLSDVERGVRSISLKNFIRIANSLEIDPSELWKQAEGLIKDGTEIDLKYGDKAECADSKESLSEIIDCQCDDESSEDLRQDLEDAQSQNTLPHKTIATAGLPRQLTSGV
jgi:transcriptional regulator with XRE-family HTH domain